MVDFVVIMAVLLSDHVFLRLELLNAVHSVLLVQARRSLETRLLVIITLSLRLSQQLTQVGDLLCELLVLRFELGHLPVEAVCLSLVILFLLELLLLQRGKLLAEGVDFLSVSLIRSGCKLGVLLTLVEQLLLSFYLVQFLLPHLFNFLLLNPFLSFQSSLVALELFLSLVDLDLAHVEFALFLLVVPNRSV